MLIVIKAIKRRKNGFETICFSFGFISLWMTTSLFPWKAIENIGGIIRTVFCMVQSPCRYLAIVMVFFMFSIAKGLEALLIDNKKMIMYALSVVTCILVFTQATYYFSTLEKTASDEQLIFDGIALYKYNMVGMGEYEPVTFDNSELDYSIEELQYLCDENAIINPTSDSGKVGLTIGPLSKSGTDYSIIIINPTDKEQILYMPITYYEGYRVENIAKSEDGKDIIPELFETEFGIVGLKIPVGYYNGVHISYHENILYRISELVSVITLVGLVIYISNLNKREG